MPIIASQHQWKDKEHIPLDSWPEDCTVQWGGRGVVLSRSRGGSYATAFFEAFPKGGGFIRGEGPTIADAEKDAFEKFKRESVCQHAWSRKSYTNGGAICRKCGAFQSVFKPIVKLQGFRDPLSASCLMMAADGHLRPDPGNPQSERYCRRTWLKARLAGIALPDFWSAPPEPSGFRQDDYARSSRKAVKDFLRDRKELLEKPDDDGAFGIFTALNLKSLQNILEEDDDALDLEP